MVGAFKFIFFVIFVQYAWGVEEWVVKPEGSKVSLVIRDFLFMLEYQVLRDKIPIQTVTITTNPKGAAKFKEIPNGVIVTGRGDTIEFLIEVDEADYTEFSVTRKKALNPSQDCIDLGDMNWYGGNQQRNQFFPIQTIKHFHSSYLSKEEINKAISERYWLSSNGLYFYVELETPLFVDQNNDYLGQLCLEAEKALPFDTHHKYYDFKYRIGVSGNAKTAHREAITRHLGKPRGYPDERMIRKPIFSTWAKYKRNVSEVLVREYAKEILDNDYHGSQLEIDDDWEECYGSLKFRDSKFPEPKKLMDDLKKDGFRVTIWTHPFINKGCDPWYEEALKKGYFVVNHAGSVDTSWWCGPEAAHIDFTKPEAANWFVNRLKRLQEEDGIDAFKFDAGETSWTPSDPVLPSWEVSPNQITIDYVTTVSQFGGLIEVRSGQGTQHLPMFVRMLDKDTEWTLNNGLPTLITTLLQMNLNGYVLVLPDMVGGNGYGSSFDEIIPPSKELFLRWLQANVFMPAIQFSFVPWDYDQETTEISHKLVKLHEEYSDYIIERFKLAVEKGEPVNPPIWWIDPEDKTAQVISDQFLLGDKILVSPVIVEGAVNRDIYLPGKDVSWKDGNTNEIHVGPKWLRNYEAPLEVLPYFIRQ